MDGKKSWPFVLALYVIRSPLMLADWFKRRINGNPTGPNPSRWDGDKK